MTLLQTQEPLPLHIVNLTVTGRCNLDCACCYQKRRKDDMTTGQLLGIIDDIANLGTQILMMPGGEPLLRKDLDELVARAAQHNIQTYLASNATLVTASRAQELKDVGLTGVCVGVEVFDPNNLEEVDRAGINETIRGITHFKNAGLETFANLIVTRQNIDFLPKTVALLVGLGINKLTLLRPKPSDDPTWFENARLGPSDLFRLQTMKTSLEATFELELVNIDCALGPLFGGLPKELLEEEKIDGCLAGTRYISIDSNGDVYPCAYLKKDEFLAGNVREMSLVEIIRGRDSYREFRNLSLQGHCGDCAMQKHCGGCRALAYYDHYDLNAPDDDCHWGNASTGRAIWMGIVFWALMVWRFLRLGTRTRRRGSPRKAQEILAKVVVKKGRRSQRKLVHEEEENAACGTKKCSPPVERQERKPLSHPRLNIITTNSSAAGGDCATGF